LITFFFYFTNEMRYDSKKFVDAVYLVSSSRRCLWLHVPLPVLVQLTIHNRLSTGQQPSSCLRR